MELAFLRTTGFERRLPALLTGVFGHRRATQAGNFSSGGGQVFFGLFHRRNCTLVVMN
jgi:hypothetical protein